MSINYKVELKKLLSEVEKLTKSYSHLLQSQSLNKTNLTIKNHTVKYSVVETNLPTWCKIDQWVIDEDMMLWKIVSINKCIINAINADESIGCMCHWRDVKPIRFRPYTYCEAERLIGKKMKYSFLNGNKQSMAITVVGECEFGCHINGFSNAHWIDRNATIDGVPFGIPEVDVDAMKEGKE